MKFLNQLNWGWRRKLPVILQNESAECGLACLAMVSSYHGLQVDMSSMRRLFSVSMMGATLNHLVHFAQAMSLSTRALKLDLEDLANLKRPCILHWNFNHFVVLKSVGKKSITIHDPAVGLREVPMDEVSASFTGVALEVWPSNNFKKATIKDRVTIPQLMGKVTGIWRTFGQILLLALALEVFVVVSPFYMQWTIDNVIVSADQDLLLTLAIAFGVLVVFQQLISLFRSWVMLYFSTNLSIQWRSNVFNHLLRLPLNYFETRHLGDVVSRFNSVEVIQRNVTTEFIEAVLDGIMSIVVLVVMFLYSVKLGLIALGVMLLYALIRWLWWRPLRLATEEQIVHAAKQQTHFLETVRGIKPIKLFQRTGTRRETWLTLLVDEINAGIRTQKLGLYYRHINGLMFGVERVVIIALGALLVIDQHFTVGALMAFMAYKDQFSGRASAMVDRLFEFRMLRLHGERLADIVFTEPEQDQIETLNDSSKQLKSLPSVVAGEPCIEVKNLNFRYSDASPQVLFDVNLCIRAGESVAIVGPSGSGKTTLMHVLLGLRQVNDGEVLIHQTPIEQLGTQAALKLVATVTQDDMLFAGSIAENIAFFDENTDMDRVQHCAKLADIHRDIDKMPMAYNTLVGDMGTVLSGGQKQRVLLARALYRQPSILVLDEATSSLDIESEERVNDAIQKLELTRIIIAHRPQTIMSADRAIVLKEGRVVAELPTNDFEQIRRAMKGEL